MISYLDEALDLAAQGFGRVSPNPAVGAGIVRDDIVVGRGFHTWAGVKHAEVLALEEAGERARGATLYVTLEPCYHQGRTPPCRIPTRRCAALAFACLRAPASRLKSIRSIRPGPLNSMKPSRTSCGLVVRWWSSKPRSL